MTGRQPDGALIGGERPATGRAWPIAVAGATVAFVAVFSRLAIGLLDGFSMFAWDFAIFDQGLWLLSRLHDPFVTVRGLGLFADHSSYVMVLIAPLYRLWDAPHALAVLTVTALGAGIPLTYALARRWGASPALAALTAGGYLVHPAVGWNIGEGFHPEVVVVPLLLGAMLLVDHERWWFAGALVAVALTAKEDVGVLVAPLGLYIALVAGRRLVGVVMACAGAVALLVNFLIVLPAWGGPIYVDRYTRFGDGAVGIAVGVVTHPLAALSEVLAGDAVVFALAMVAGLPLAVLAPRALLIGVPAYLVDALSASPFQTDVRYHYTIYLLVTVTVAAAAGAGKLADRRPSLRRGLVAVTLGVTALTAIAFGPEPISASGPWRRPDMAAEQLGAAVAAVPDGAVVAAWDTTVPLLSHRVTIYVFPVPWRPAGYGDLEDEPPDPAGVEWVLMRRDQYPDLQPLVDELASSDEFHVVVDRPPVLLLQRRP